MMREIIKKSRESFSIESIFKDDEDSMDFSIFVERLTTKFNEIIENVKIKDPDNFTLYAISVNKTDGYCQTDISINVFRYENDHEYNNRINQISKKQEENKNKKLKKILNDISNLDNDLLEQVVENIKGIIND
jgi:hypothetical protein